MAARKATTTSCLAALFAHNVQTVMSLHVQLNSEMQTSGPDPSLLLKKKKATVVYDWESGLAPWVEVPYGTNVFSTQMPRRLPTTHFAGCNGCPSGSCTCTGDYFITTDENDASYQTDAWTGILESPEFTLSALSEISYGIGGGNHAMSIAMNPGSPSGSACAFTLEIFNPTTTSWIIAKQDTGRNQDTIEQKTWSAHDLSPFAGNTARLRIYDMNTGGWGHIAIDDVFLYEVTAAGAAGDAAATGDPHLQNIHGERFDLMKPGRHVLINIPLGARAEDAVLRVEAEARRLGGGCTDMYFQKLNVTGAWAEAKQTGGYHYDSQVDVKESPGWLTVGKLEVKIAHGRTQKGARYLNFYVKHLGRAGFAVGGLLGEAYHHDVTIPPAGCSKQVALRSVTHASNSSEQSVAIAIVA